MDLILEDDTRWCGTTPGHCLSGNGCQSGCTVEASSPTSSVVSPTASTSPRSDGRCGAAFGGSTCDSAGPFGGCCSTYGHVLLLLTPTPTQSRHDVG